LRELRNYATFEFFNTIGIRDLSGRPLIAAKRSHANPLTSTKCRYCCKVPKVAAANFSPKNEASDDRHSIGPQTRYENRLQVWCVAAYLANRLHDFLHGARSIPTRQSFDRLVSARQTQPVSACHDRKLIIVDWVAGGGRD
jgi:hypothetical protein